MATSSAQQFKKNPPRPTEVAKETLDHIERAERMVFKWHRADLAKEALSRSRKQLIVLPYPMSYYWGMTETQVEDYIGTNVDKINEEIRNLAVDMSVKEHEQLQHGEFVVDDEDTKRIYEIKNDVENLLEIFEAIDEGIIGIERENPDV